MTDLVSRLLEAIGETERLARACGEPGLYGSWFYVDGDETVRSAGNDYVACGPWQGPVEADYARHIVRHDPGVVLRRCAADRKQLDLHGIVHRDIGWLEWDEGEYAEMYAELPVCGLCVPKHSSFPRREDVPEGPCRTVRILAESYGLSDHQEGEE